MCESSRVFSSKHMIHSFGPPRKQRKEQSPLSQTLSGTGLHLVHEAAAELSSTDAPLNTTDQLHTPAEVLDLTSLPPAPVFFPKLHVPGKDSTFQGSVVTTNLALQASKMEALLSAVLPIVESAVADLVRQLVADFQKKHPDQNIWQVFENAISKLYQTEVPRIKAALPQIYQKLHVAAFVAKISNFCAPLIKLVDADKTVTNPRDLALHWDTAKITSALESAAMPGATDLAATIRKRLFHDQPTGTIQGMVHANKIGLTGKAATLKTDVVKILSRLGPKDMADRSPATLFAAEPELLKDIPSERIPAASAEVVRLARAQSLAPTTASMQALVNEDTTSAHAISKMDRGDFLGTHSEVIGSEVADQVHANAVAITARNERILMSLLEMINGTGLNAIDGDEKPSARILRVQRHMDDQGYQLSLQDLFGSMDQATSNESATVYSAASYFVDLLEFLRNNNLENSTVSPDNTVENQPPSTAGTVLDYLFRRRPDLGNLELTPGNTDIVIPYIDLVNEVMESFIIHLTSYTNDAQHPRQATIDAFNVGSEDTEELLSQPQNVNISAYREVASSPYPTSLPYHQPLDTQRVFLEFLKLSRADLVQTFRPKPPSLSTKAVTTASLKGDKDPNTTLTEYQKKALDNQVNCERLGLSQEEFLILTKKVFWQREFFELTEGITLSSEEYSAKVGLMSICECWGYATEAEMLAENKVTKSGLQFVEKQLLPRAGIVYTDLIDIVQTRFVNPGLPSGRDKAILDSLQFSYQFLQTLVDQGYTTPIKRYGRLADFLVRSTRVLNLAKLLQDDTSDSTKVSSMGEDGKSTTNQITPPPLKLTRRDVKSWVLENFERLGKVVVLDSGEGPVLEAFGQIIATRNDGKDLPVLPTGIMGVLTPDGRILDQNGREYGSGAVASLAANGVITDNANKVLGNVTISGKVLFGNSLDGNTWNNKFPMFSLDMLAMDVSWVILDGVLKQKQAPSENGHIVEWELSEGLGGSGSIEDVRLIHLDGTRLEPREWDRLHRFIRLWRKITWSVTETDEALTGLSTKPARIPDKPIDQKQHIDGDLNPKEFTELVTFNDFVDPTPIDCSPVSGRLPLEQEPEITVSVIEQLAAIVQILPLISLTVEQLLTFWAPMSSRGPTSLYYRLFFTRNLRGKDTAFVPDQNGNYFTGQASKISAHSTIILAALNLKATDLDFLLGHNQPVTALTIASFSETRKSIPIPIPDILSLENISAIYRSSLLAKILGVKITDLGQIMQAFGNLFHRPTDSLNLLQKWAQMNTISFPWEELRYILDSVPSPQDPLAPTKVDCLSLSKTLHDGIIAIQAAHPFILNEIEATDFIVEKETTFVFDKDTVNGIIALVNGTTEYTTKAPEVRDPEFQSLVAGISEGKSLKYLHSNASDAQAAARLQVIGILTDDEVAKLKTVIDKTTDMHSKNTDVSMQNGIPNGVAELTPQQEAQKELRETWMSTVNNLCAQSRNFFYDSLIGIFPRDVVANELQDSTVPQSGKRVLLAGDIPPPKDEPVDQTGKSTDPTNKSASNMNGIGIPTKDGSTKGASAVEINGAVEPKPIGTSGTPTRPQKTLFFLKYFIPFLQSELANSFIIETIASNAGFANRDLVETLLKNVITLGDSSQSALSFLLETIGTSANVWQGCLVPDTSTEYIFYLPYDGLVNGALDGSAPGESPPEPLVLEGVDLLFNKQKVEKSTVWATRPQALDMAQIYDLSISKAAKHRLQWQANDSGLFPIPDSAFTAWKGYLSLPTSDTYTFSITMSLGSPNAIMIDNERKGFRLEQVDPIIIWSTDPITLDNTKLHTIELRGCLPTDLLWKAKGSSRTKIPDSAFLPSFAESQMSGLLNKLKKLALFFTHFRMSSDEVLYIHDHATEDSSNPLFAGLTFESITSLAQWQTVYDYVQLRDSLPVAATISLLDLFAWAQTDSDTAQRKDDVNLAHQIYLATSWPESQILEILRRANFSTDTSLDFRDHRILVLMKPQIVYAKQLGVDIWRLSAWATPLGTGTRDFFKYSDVAFDIQKVARSFFDLDSWAQAVRPLNNTLRENRKNALINYLLVQNDFVETNKIVDADGLFEYFLIDVQMTSLVETSRIKQAISSVQLFVQRCMLGLEEDSGVGADRLSRDKWAWMKSYRLWEANRKVFLYPENYIVPSLRDDKSELFKQLESQLLQKDLSKDVVYASLRSFLYGVDSVSNLEAIGLFVDSCDAGKIHVFARTRTVPFSYYYNWYLPGPSPGNEDKGSWNGWQNMAIEIPHCTDPDTGAIGNYVAPVVFNGRLMLFVAEVSKYTAKQTAANDQTFQAVGNGKINNVNPRTYWEFRLSWTEYRNSAWSTRQTSPFSYIDLINDAELQRDGPPQMQSYNLIPSIVQAHGNDPDSAPAQSVKIYLSRLRQINPRQLDAGWLFDGTQLSQVSVSATTLPITSGTYALAPTSFNIVQAAMSMYPPSLHSLQVYERPNSDGSGSTLTFNLITTSPYIEDADSYKTNSALCRDIGGPSIVFKAQSNDPSQLPPSHLFYHKFIHDLVVASAGSGDVASVFASLSNIGGSATNLEEAFGALSHAQEIPSSFNEQHTLYSLYNWELGLHAPMILIDRLFTAQQYEQALSACEYVFNPTKAGQGRDVSRFWIFQPFKSIKKSTIESMFDDFTPGVENINVTDWRKKPFEPHVVARGRPQAYMKWIVVMYIKILIAYGDSLFRQNTLETVPMAIQLYVLASHIYGPRGQIVPRQAGVKPKTYNGLVTQLDAFSNAMVQLEEAFPFSNQTTLPISKLPDSTGFQMANIFGSAGTLYFAIPDNPALRELATTIDDRLFKIRNSQDINGIFRQLPLFEPPIDPMLLVQATAQGLSLSSVLTDLSGPMPNCKFQFLLQKALDLASETRNLGQALLAVREKKDAEVLSVLRSRHDLLTQTAVMDMKKLAVKDANQALAVLEYNRKAPVSRLSYYLTLIGDDLSGIPDLDREFLELDAKLEKPVSEGGMALSSSEQEGMSLSDSAAKLNVAVGAINTVAGVLYALPNTNEDISPLGCGVTLKWGASNMAMLMDSVAKGLSMGVDNLNYQSSMAGTKSQYQRALQDRILQANAAGYEISSIDKQITAAQIRLDIANKDIELQQNQIDQAQEVNDYLLSKYSNAELYSWMDGATKTLFYTTYSQAVALALKADKAFRYERPQKSPTSYIEPGYWDASRDGLLSGENLYVALKRLEEAWMEITGYDYEITKSVSLRMLDPMALINLRESGSCTFTIPEILFDMDFPGHYLRRIKSVAITIPCLVGPYTGINAILRLQSSKYRIDNTLAGSQFGEVVDSGANPDPRFSIAASPPTSAIAASSGLNDAGVFQLDFSDSSARYMPFEGAGAISTWQLDLPKSVRQFSYDSISDVIVQLRYTSVDGGDQFASKAEDWVEKYLKLTDYVGMSGGLVALFDVKNEYASDWSRLLTASQMLAKTKGSDTQPPPPALPPLTMPDMSSRLPIFTRNHAPENILAKDFVLLTDSSDAGDKLNLAAMDDAGNFTKTIELALSQDDANTLKQYKVSGAALPFTSWKMVFPKGNVGIKRCFMLVRYSLS